MILTSRDVVELLAKAIRATVQTVIALVSGNLVAVAINGKLALGNSPAETANDPTNIQRCVIRVDIGLDVVCTEQQVDLPALVIGNHVGLPNSGEVEYADTNAVVISQRVLNHVAVLIAAELYVFNLHDKRLLEEVGNSSLIFKMEMQQCSSWLTS